MGTTGLLTTDSKDAFSSTAGTSTASHLIPRSLYDELFSAVKKKLVLSSLAARRIGPNSIPGSTVKVTTQTGEEMSVARVEQGAEIPLDQEEYGGFELTPVKYGVRIGITRELIEDSNWDVMAMNVQTAGYEFADNEEQLIVSTLNSGDSAASNSVANSNSTIALTDITEAIQNLEANNYNPTHMIVGAEVANDLRNLDIDPVKGGVNDPTNRLIGKLFGMKIIMSNNVSAKLAYVIDADHAFVIAEKRPVTIERYFEAARDTEYAVATQRIAVRYLRSGAISEITTT